MSLQPAASPEQLFSTRGEDVNEHRPLFTGDVFDDVDIPGIGRHKAMIIGHPCSIRGRAGSLQDQLPVATVRAHERIASEKWSSGFYNRMPLPGLIDHGSYDVAYFDQIGLAASEDLVSSSRLACLSHEGINQLQQRLVFHLTRVEVPTGEFHRAFDHTYEEADLLEEWSTDRALAGSDSDPGTSFETWIRGGQPSRQSRLEMPEQRAGVRREMRSHLKLLA